MATRMVKLKNMVNKTVSVKLPEYGINKRWTAKGQTVPIPYETMEQILWHDGFRKMIDRGILYIEDMQDKIDLGLEEEGATEPSNIIVLSDKQIETLLTVSPIDVFKRELDNVSETQVNSVINYAILHKLMDMNKIDYLEKRVPGTDILRAISMEKQIEKAEAAEK